MATKYDADFISRFYDEYAEQEWHRFEGTPSGAVSLHIHNWYLSHYVKASDHVLDAGAGPGRFTIELAKLAAKVTVGDISPQQLNLNRAKVEEAGCEHTVVARELIDIVDLSRFPTATFDTTVCYGGPLSYVFDQADGALAELLRVTKPGGYVLLGVMSLLGSTRAFLPGIFKVAHQHGLDVVNEVNATGDLYGAVAPTHRCHMYRWSELESLIKQHSLYTGGCIRFQLSLPRQRRIATGDYATP